MPCVPRLGSNGSVDWALCRSVVAICVLALSTPDLVSGDDVTISYGRDIRPILSENCFRCHGPDAKARQAELRLDRREEALADRDGTFPIFAGRPQDSLVLARVTASDPTEVMPPPETKKSLSQREIELLARWIEQGAEYQDHWSFRPIRRVDPPAVQDVSWVRNDIDRFVLARLEAQGIKPAASADRSTQIRRLYLDLIGLPPPPAAVERFAANTDSRPYSELVEDLLASDHYGERWGRHWLDQARYADSHGYTIDGDRTMWPFRDWVIKALNDDMPFDQFTIEQIAGDLLPAATKSQKIASGFHRNTLINQEGGTDDEQFRNEEVVDRVSTTGAVWLGLTVGCAQCHAHKYDPISQREFYELFAFFNQTEDVNDTGPTVDVAENELFLDSVFSDLLGLWETSLQEVASLEASRAERQREWEDQLRSAAKEPQQTDAEFVKALATDPKERNKAQQKLLGDRFAAGDQLLNDARKRVASLKNEMGLGDVVKTMVMRDRSDLRETYIHVRGDFLRPDESIGALDPNVPAVFAGLPAAVDTPNRLHLARWLVRDDHPLTARVTVNRVWMRYFGTGIVETENDFGTQGAYPTHPELLDWLAATFIEGGWSLKQLHRLIVTSATYRQSSLARPELTEVDPGNRLLACQNRLRFDAEIVRDAALVASGLLEPRIGGPSVRPPQPAGVYAFTQRKIKWQANTDRGRFRRGMYTQFYRSAPYPLLTTFDSPDFQSVCTARSRSNTPLQSLALANDASLFELAQGLGARLMSEVSGDDEEARQTRIRRAFLICLARQPSPTELQAVARFQQLQLSQFNHAGSESAAKAAPAKYPQSFTAPAAASWTAVARALMNTDEFITRE